MKLLKTTYFENILILFVLVATDVLTDLLTPAFDMYPYARAMYLGFVYLIFRDWKNYRYDVLVNQLYDSPVSQFEISISLKKWKSFRPGISHILEKDIYQIKREQNIVTVGHLNWLYKKVLGEVSLNESPPHIVARLKL